MAWLAGILAVYILMRDVVAFACVALFAMLLVTSSVYSARRAKREAMYWAVAALGSLGLCLVVRVVGYAGAPNRDDYVGFIYDWLDTWPVLVGFWGGIICTFLSRSDQPNARALSGMSWAFLMSAAYSFYLYRH